MKNYYYGLTQNGYWIWFCTKQHVRNCKTASAICGETIQEFRLVPFTHYLLRFFILRKENKRGK